MARAVRHDQRQPQEPSVIFKPTILALSILLLTTAGCTRIKDVKGYVADNELTQEIKPGVDNKQSVAKTLGNPSVQSDFNGNTWYYVSEKTSQLAFLWPKPTKHDVIKVDFDDKGNVSAIGRLGIDQVVRVNPAGGATPTRGRQFGFWEQLLGSIGRFGASPEAQGAKKN
ncbi:MAG: outer membrane protein assembly factor BamE [Sphingomonadales bacterium]|nr:MAG: outer membrane protein assembly factor BamE [Sphingomonadales bacterium]